MAQSLNDSAEAHENASLTPKGREDMARAVVDRRLNQAHRLANSTVETGGQMDGTPPRCRE
jgi:hypothetical protein